MSTATEISVNVGETPVKGLLKDYIERGKGEKKAIEHIIVAPAPDEYSHPITYPVRASKLLGQVGVEIALIAKVQSWKSNGYWNTTLWAVEE